MESIESVFCCVFTGRATWPFGTSLGQISHPPVTLSHQTSSQLTLDFAANTVQCRFNRDPPGAWIADLRFLVGPDPYLVKQFTNVISSVSRRTARRWQAVGSRFVSIYDQLAQRFANVESYETRPLQALRGATALALRKLPAEERLIGRESGW